MLNICQFRYSVHLFPPNSCPRAAAELSVLNISRFSCSLISGWVWSVASRSMRLKGRNKKKKKRKAETERNWSTDFTSPCQAGVGSSWVLHRSFYHEALTDGCSSSDLGNHASLSLFRLMWHGSWILCHPFLVSLALNSHLQSIPLLILASALVDWVTCFLSELQVIQYEIFKDILIQPYCILYIHCIFIKHNFYKQCLISWGKNAQNGFKEKV